MSHSNNLEPVRRLVARWRAEANDEIKSMEFGSEYVKAHSAGAAAAFRLAADDLEAALTGPTERGT